MLDIAAPLQWTLGGIYGTLTFAGLATNLIKKTRPTWDVAEVMTRIKTWWAMTLVFTLALVAGTAVSIVLFAAISLLAMREFHRLAGLTHPIAVGLSFSAVPVAYGLIALGYPAAGWLAPIAAAAVVPMAVALAGHTDGFLQTISTAAVGLLLTLWAPLHAVLLLVMPASGPASGAGMLVFLVLVTEVGDVAQFLSGKAFGKVPIAPAVSPNKTRGGLIGGVAVAATLGFAIGAMLTPLSALTAATTAAILVLFGFSGDLVISAIKRDRGVKDAGSLLPGHGGVLDRIDSLIATAPLFALIAYLVS